MAKTEYGTTWWGQKWLDSLTNIDYSNRIPRGKTYANNGSVLSFEINEKEHDVTAKIKGHYHSSYKAKINLLSIPEKQVTLLIDEIVKDPQIVAKLASNILDPKIFDICENLKIKLFPKTWHDLEGHCSCPDHAVPCKHLAAVIYKVCSAIDANPFLLFKLKGIDLIKELKKRNINLEDTQKCKVPTLQDLVCVSNSLTTEANTTESQNIQVNQVQATEANNNVQNDNIASDSPITLNDIDFSSIDYADFVDFDNSPLIILDENPAGYTLGSLKKKIHTHLKNAAKLAKNNLNDKNTRTIPSISNTAEPWIEFNIKGSYKYNDTISALGDIESSSPTEYKNFLGTTDFITKLEKCSGYKLKNELNTTAFCNLFSSGISKLELRNASEETELLYHIWLLATKLVQGQAIIPQLYKASTDTYKIRWIPAITDKEIVSLLTNLGKSIHTLPFIDNLIHIKNAPGSKTTINLAEISDIELCNILLGAFISSYMQLCYSSNIPTALDNVYDVMLLGSEINSKTEANKSTVIGLDSWLQPLYIANSQLTPILKLNEVNSENSNTNTDAETNEPTSFKELEFEAQLFFAPHNINTAPLIPENYISTYSILKEETYAQYKMDSLRSINVLTTILPEISQVISDPSQPIKLKGEDLSNAVFKSLPLFKVLGIELVIPKSLNKILRPNISLKFSAAPTSNNVSSINILAEILQFNWTHAIGEHEITPQDFEKLLQKTNQLVRFKDEYVYVDPETIAAIEKRLLESQDEIPTKQDVLVAALLGEYKNHKVVLTKEIKDKIEDLLKVENITVPDSINATLRPYQIRGFSWLYKNAHCGIGSIIADDMGLGKTLQVITTLEKLRLNDELTKQAALVIVPTSLLFNWSKELTKFAPQMTYGLVYGSEKQIPKDKNIILTSYGTFKNNVKLFNKTTYRLVVIDEAQAIKNATTAVTKAVKSLKADSFIAMSGTPVENRLSEYWSIMDFTNKGILGTLNKFNTEYARPIEKSYDKKALKKFTTLTKPFIMRRLKTDKSIIADLPEKLISNEYCSLTPVQASLYQSVVDEAIGKLDNHSNVTKERLGIIIKMITDLKQICNTPAQFIKNSPNNNIEDSGKAERLFELLDDLIQNNKKPLIFTQFKETGELIQKWFQERFGSELKFIHGGVNVSNRQKIVESFQNTREDKALLLSLRAAGTGLNLTKAQAVIHFDLWWNPAVEAQATDRAYRIGQKNDVLVYRFITADTFEEKINAMIESKKRLADMTVETGENWIGNLSNKEIKEIFTIKK